MEVADGEFEADGSEPDQGPLRKTAVPTVAEVYWHTIWRQPLSTYCDADDGGVHAGWPHTRLVLLCRRTQPLYGGHQ